ncbi:MAG: Helix-turn-helix type 11 domain protein, partial [Actinomycetia bacterium]|nr:Helix-turn-helix type 11 domain protein [Actinomycetes bacterium]
AHLAGAPEDSGGADGESAGVTSAPRARADGDAEWAEVQLRFAAVMAARILLSFGGDVEVISPPEVRKDLTAVAAQVVALYAPDEPIAVGTRAVGCIRGTCP